MDFLANLNTGITGEAIRNILSHLGEKNLPSRKADMAQRLNQIWLEEPSRLLDALSEPERMLLAECAQSCDTIPDVARLNAKHGFKYSIPYQSGWRDHHVILCFIGRDGYGDSHSVVDGIMDRLKTLLPPPPALKVRSGKATPAEGRWPFKHWDDTEKHKTRALRCYESERVAPLEVRRMLQLAAAGKLRVSDATGMPSEATQKTVGAALCAPDLDLAPPAGEHRPYRESDIDPGPVRAFAWPVLLQQCGWAKPKSGRLDLMRKGKELLGEFTFARYAEGVQSFVSDSVFDELRRVTVIKGQSGRRASRGKIPPGVRRDAIVECLRELPCGEWVEVEEAHRVLLALGGEGRVVDDGMSLYIAELQYGHLSGNERVIVTFRDDETAALVAHDNAAGKAVLCREGASVVVRSRNTKAFQSALRSLGILMP